ncbi:hypothetical protein [Larkinella sp. C7]|jgi:hypothetical protein|uniref:hypothetical protein n=1 Tax=Larkinella sp. C7 TaxID=2576607 RepID=UPI001111106A|nr:hypothetical protein [Larkinella sp. C7]
MRQIILNQLTAALAARHTYFIREQDVQLYLANYCLQTGMYDNVFIEYHVPGALVPPYLWTDANNIYIDIVLEKESQFYPIEIKYKTTTQPLQHLVFGQNVNVLLGQHGAQNIGCYDFWKDIKRTEFFEATFPFCQRGIVLFISNDLSYQKAPLNSNVGYAPFSIHQGRHIAAGTQLNWNGALAVSNGRPGFTVNHDYTINWAQLPYHQQHYYILT